MSEPTASGSVRVSGTDAAARDSWTSADDAGRHENEAERLDRNLTELMQELRVASIGVQVLFGFLLALPFTTQFSRLSNAQELLYTGDLVLAAIAAAMFISPVVHHRITFQHHQKASLLRFANAVALGGLLALGLTISGVVLLVVSFIWNELTAWLLAVALALIIFGMWFAVPRLYRARDDY